MDHLPIDFIARIQKLVNQVGPLQAYRQMIAENNAQILTPKLDHGESITAARTAIYTTLVAGWAEAQQRTLGYDRPFAVVALGGTGRGEVTPCSDLDLAFLFEDDVVENSFLDALMKQTMHTTEFEEHYGFQCTAFPFGLHHVHELEDKQLNAFLDLHPVYDPTGLTGKLRQKIRDSYDPFEHFLHVRNAWKTQWEAAGEKSEYIKSFDIKNDGLRLFLGGGCGRWAERNFGIVTKFTPNSMMLAI